MKIDGLIHPEILLDLRGTKAEREVWKETIRVLNHCKVSGDEVSFNWDTYKSRYGYEPLTQYVLDSLKTQMLRKLAIFYKNFITGVGTGKSKMFYVPKDFATALAKIDKIIPLSVLPEEFYYYIHFSKNAFPISELSNVDGVYFSRSKKNCEDGDDEAPLMVSSVVRYINEDGKKDEIGHGIGCFFSTEHASNKTMEEILEHLKDGITTMPASNAYLGAFRSAINAAVYAHSSDPAMLALFPQRNATKKQKKAYKIANIENLCSVKLIILNREYACGRTWHVDGTTVSGHLRWQPCGTGRQQVKLIWVDEHERTYKKGDTNGTTIEAQEQDSVRCLEKESDTSAFCGGEVRC